MTRRPIVLALLLSLLAIGHAAASDLPTTKPEQVGLSSERLGRIGQVLRADVERGRIPGAVVVVARKGRVASLQAVGFRDKAAGTPMTPDSIFRIASMTKPIVTVAALSLYEEGRLLPSDPVSKYIPAFKNQAVGLERAPAEREMTIQDLMRHTSGLTYGNRGQTEIHKMYPESSSVSSLTLTMDELIERLSRAPLLYQPGTRWEYGLSTDVLGRVVEIVSGQSLGEVLAERVYRPLKMTDTTFLVPADKRARIAQGLPAHPDTGVEFKLADPSVPRKFDCGGGCAVSTAGDYARFAQMLLNRGTLDGARVLSPRTVEFMTADHLGAISRGTGSTGWPGYTWGLGVAVRQDKGIAPIPGSPGDFYWPGAYATYWWADPKEELVVVFMTQSPLGRHYQHLVRGLVYQAIAH
ncbi:MAG: serine hydrolase [Candidatus Rokuibacteriota bacterium]|nr:MAG: serine hydrolase [Candidatus Rokubacteria bacterium]